MVEQKIISTVTDYSVIGNAISITSTYLEDELPDTISVLIADSIGSQNSVPFIENEFLIQMKNSPDNIDYLINEQGELILLISTGDEDNYSINDNGDLIYEGDV